MHLKPRQRLACVRLATLLALCTPHLLTHPCSAEPSAARLAVLEVQGSYGSLSERLRYSDTMRQEALKALSPLGISVIDRASLELLLPPSRALSDCVGACSVEVARMIGAHWSLSSHMDHDEQALHITLKLHSARGELLAVAQEDLSQSSTPPLSARLPSALRALTREALTPLSPTPNAPPQDPAEAPPQVALEGDVEGDVEGDLAPPPAVRAPSPQHQPLTWRFVRSPRGAQGRGRGRGQGRRRRRGRCVSGPVPNIEYARCVEEGACEPLNTLNGCLEAREANAQARCVSFSNALSFAQWRAERAGVTLSPLPRLLPTLNELKRARLPELSSGALSVWTARPKSPRAPLNSQALKVAPREPLASMSRRGGGLSARLTPPAFRLKEVALVVSLPARSARACERLNAEELAP